MTKILVCDDHLAVAEALALVLESAGHTVVAVVNNPCDALEHLAVAEVDVCVMDLRYGDECGLPGIAIIAERYPNIRVVVFSGHLEGDLVDQVSAAGVSAWGVKRADLASVVALVVGEN